MTGPGLRLLPPGVGYRYGQQVPADDWPGEWVWVVEPDPGHPGVTVTRPVLRPHDP